MCDESTNTCNLFLLFDEQTSGGDRVITQTDRGRFWLLFGLLFTFSFFFQTFLLFSQTTKKTLKSTLCC